MLSVVILSYNRCTEVLVTIAELKKFVPNLPFPVEIIVVDNASVDDTTAQVKTNHPDVRLVTKMINNGIAGWNDGFAIAKYKYFLVLDDDSNPESGIKEAVEYLETNKDTGILALNITSGPYQTDTWEWRNGTSWQHEQKILGFFGCGAIIRKEVYDKIGGFADWLLVYGHEWEYGIRCIDAGYDIKYFKNSSINHRASSINRSQRRARIFGTRNDMAIVYKYFSYKRWSYIFIMFLNNLKRLRDEDVKSVYYDFLGFIEFLRLKKKLSYTPVSKATQIFFIDNYMNTQPIFQFIIRKFKKQ